MTAAEYELAHEIIEGACLEMSVESTFLPAYSGRGMHGRSCPAVTTGDIYQLGVRIGREIQQAGEDGKLEPNIHHVLIRWLTCGHAVDHMGRDWVVYWPDLQKPK